MDFPLSYMLLVIKTGAAGSVSTLQCMEQIREKWDTSEAPDFAIRRVHIGVQIDLVVEVYEEVVNMADEVLRSPPPYNQSPKERRLRMIELHVLSTRPATTKANLRIEVNSLHEQVHEPLGTRIEQAYAIMIVLSGDAKEMINTAWRWRRRILETTERKDNLCAS